MIDLKDKSKNVFFIFGSAGTGKTSLLKHLMKIRHRNTEIFDDLSYQKNAHLWMAAKAAITKSTYLNKDIFIVSNSLVQFYYEEYSLKENANFVWCILGCSPEDLQILTNLKISSEFTIRNFQLETINSIRKKKQTRPFLVLTKINNDVEIELKRFNKQ